jgi:plastocyanin
LLLTAVSIGSGIQACGSGSSTDDRSGNTVTVKMLDNSFEPAELTVKGGTTVELVSPNVGKVAHNLHIASGRGVYRESPWIALPDPTEAGVTARLTWNVPPTPGTYKFRCDYHEVEMVGTITVE